MLRLEQRPVCSIDHGEWRRHQRRSTSDSGMRGQTRGGLRDRRVRCHAMKGKSDDYQCKQLDQGGNKVAYAEKRLVESGFCYVVLFLWSLSA